MKDLKLTKVIFEEIDEGEVKKILPDCNIEIKECYFDGLEPTCTIEEYIDGITDDSSDSDDV